MASRGATLVALVCYMIVTSFGHQRGNQKLPDKSPYQCAARCGGLSYNFLFRAPPSNGRNISNYPIRDMSKENDLEALVALERNLELTKVFLEILS